MFPSSTSITPAIPLLTHDHDQSRSPSSSSSSYYYHFLSNDDQIYPFSFDDTSDYDLSFLDPPNNHHDFSSSCFALEQTPVWKETAPTAAASAESSDSAINTACMPPPTNFDMNEFGRERADAGSRIAFRMKTELEIIDDGYRWRKYGKKKVKDSPNLRNYYRCSTIGCNVKKRVERDKDDSSYVITAYDGVHNHESPSMIHNKNNRPTGEWNFQSSTS